MTFRFDSKQFQVVFNGMASGERRAAIMAQEAQRLLEETRATNAQILGRVPNFRQFIDGREGAAFEDVRPGGVIRVQFDVVTEVARFVVAILNAVSPYDPTPDGQPHYRDRHFVIVDDVIVDFPYTEVETFDRMLIINDRVYSNFLEARYAVYESLAFPIVHRLFGRSFDINLARDDYFGDRNLGILIRPL